MLVSPFQITDWPQSQYARAKAGAVLQKEGEDADAAKAGAPLGHDFCTISLSDLLTPWEHIQRRVKAAGEGSQV